METTGWTLQFANGGVHHIRVKGGRGRISFSAQRGEVRVYRNESTKTYEAVFTSVTHVVSDRVETIPVHWGKNGSMDPGSEPRFKGEPPKAEPEEIKGTIGWAKVKGKPLKPLNPEDF